MATNRYEPNYAVPPGWVLAEYLEVRGTSQTEFARLCGRSRKSINEIVAGKAALQPKAALQFERVLGLDARIWMGMEADYRLHKARVAEAEELAAAVVWAKKFPRQELAKRGSLLKGVEGGELVSNLLSFFGVGTLDAWNRKYESMKVAYRHSPSFNSSQEALASWLRLGELEAKSAECPEYVETRFRSALQEIHGITLEPMDIALPKTRALCNEAGVVLAYVSPLPRAPLSGAAYWLSSKKAVIQLSGRHKTNDHFWFSFFHEAAHLLLHSRNSIFVDNMKVSETDEDEVDEGEANEWAAEFLIPRNDWRGFVQAAMFEAGDVRNFATEQGIAPGIVVGRLQHKKLISGGYLNELKENLRESSVHFH